VNQKPIDAVKVRKILVEHDAFATQHQDLAVHSDDVGHFGPVGPGGSLVARIDAVILQA